MHCDHRPRRRSETPILGEEIAEGVVEPPANSQSREARQRAAQVAAVVELECEAVGFAVGRPRERIGRLVYAA